MTQLISQLCDRFFSLWLMRVWLNMVVYRLKYKWTAFDVLHIIIVAGIPVTIFTNIVIYQFTDVFNWMEGLTIYLWVAASVVVWGITMYALGLICWLSYIICYQLLKLRAHIKSAYIVYQSTKKQSN